jgi:hypothetical protein
LSCRVEGAVAVAVTRGRLRSMITVSYRIVSYRIAPYW